MRLIDAEALINEWNGLIKLMATNSDGVVPVNFWAVIGAVSKAPTVDAVEVVRCKDCKYWAENRGDSFCASHDGLFAHTKPDDFCSYGERKSE